jgi:hypothetical protein
MAFIKRHKVPLVLAMVKFILPYSLQNPVYELHRDEFLYLAEGLHLDWGYMEVPPLLSLFAKLTHLMGGGFFWVKFWPALFGAFTVWLVCLMVREMGGTVYAQVLAGICMTVGAYMRINFLFQPGFLEVFWWTLMAYFIVKYINTHSLVFIYLLGVAAGFSWLSKYSVLFLAAGLFAALLLTPYRKLFTSKHLYLSIGIAFVIALPNLVWQYSHRWPVAYHMQELRETQLVFVNPLEFLMDQILIHLPCFFIWIAGLAWLLFSPSGRQYRMLAWMYLTIILLLILSSGKSYYSLGAYPMLFAAGAVCIDQLTRLRFRWARYTTVGIVLMIFLPFIPVLLPVWQPGKLARYYKVSGFDKTGLLRWEDLQDHPLPQDFADMLGWKEMAGKVSRTYASLPDTIKRATLVYCESYGQAGAVTYYGKGLPQVHTDNASFLFWMPDKYNIRHILMVDDKVPDADDKVFQQFESAIMLDSIENPLSREYGAKIWLYRNGNDQLRTMVEAGIREEKDKFRRQ